jgi:homoserine O-acetyltransferase
VDPALFNENARLAAGGSPSLASVGALTTISGAVIENVQIAYHTFGRHSGDNAIFICHALTGTSNAVAWWDRIVGPGLAVDTNIYYVICANLLGGCQGSTGPSTIVGGKPIGSRFPVLTVADQNEASFRLLTSLGINKLHAVIGCSTGGFHALEFSRDKRIEIRKLVVSAGGPRQNARQLALNEAARQAIMRDPKWRNGDYPLEDPPRNGLSVARMIGHIAYLSGEALEIKFGRRPHDDVDFAPGPRFAVESYLNYQGDKFVDRFDANSFLTLTRAANLYDLQFLTGASCDFLFIAFTSDTLFPIEMSEELHSLATTAGCDSEIGIVDLPFGHDGFLLDGEQQGTTIGNFLK